MSAGPCLVMEVRQENAVESFRKFRLMFSPSKTRASGHNRRAIQEPVNPPPTGKLCGPIDPEIAAHLRPNTIRAQFGKNRIENAIHCTDLPEDGLLESEYFFNILHNRATVV